MMPDPKKKRIIKSLPKCKVNGCIRKGDFKNGICDKCFQLMNKKQSAKKKERKTIIKNSNLKYPAALRNAKRTFQLLRRLQESDVNGICLCVHGFYKHYTKLDAGHFIPAKYLATCFDSMNVHPQSKHKNMDMDNPITNAEYRNFMVKKYGLEAVENLILRSKKLVKYSVFELEEMAKNWQKEIDFHLLRIRSK